jgi:transposase IS116/IS110/IS902 family protein
MRQSGGQLSGIVPGEESSGDRQRLGHISKQGNTRLRFLMVEAAQVAVPSDAEWRRKYFHLALRRGRKIAKVAMARRLAVRLHWMWRSQTILLLTGDALIDRVLNDLCLNPKFLACLLCLPPLGPTCFLGGDNAFASSWRHRSLSGSD